jgi:hypothetical protein
MRIGVPFQTGTETPMVKACSVVFAALDLSGDPRDALRTLERRHGLRAHLEARLPEPPPPSRRRAARKGANSKGVTVISPPDKRKSE